MSSDFLHDAEDALEAHGQPYILLSRLHINCQATFMGNITQDDIEELMDHLEDVYLHLEAQLD